MWRWSRQSQTNQTFDRVFSTYVEVILLSRKIFYLKQCILHVCGGDPRGDACQLSWWVYSPRMWRWSSWKLSNLLTKDSILHVCGGDPVMQANHLLSVRYSPRMWRWSFLEATSTMSRLVFSTYVEVIPIFMPLPMKKWWYSPRMWRYCYIGIPEEIMNVIIRDHKEKF